MALFRRKNSSSSLEPAKPGEAAEIPVRREELVMALRPQGHLAEQYRRLRNSIQALNPDGAARTVLLTSAVRGEGKSVATLNMALAMVEVPRVRVLVIDGHVRHPSLEEYLGVPRRQGLTDVLLGQLPLEQAIRRTSVDRLDIMGAGTLPDDPRLGLFVERMQSILHTLKRRYDYILIDMAPAMLVAEPSLLGTIADGILLVVRLGETPKHLVEETYNMLETLGGNVLGIVANGAHEADRAE
ncbi:MAG: CpsD/CapB family tyrosine-protein kinase [Planctomycetota bacterium]